MKETNLQNCPSSFELLPEERQQRLIDWIDTNLSKIKSFNQRHTSYGLKHFVTFNDNSDEYFTNGEFKGAMLRCGYRVKNELDLNWIFNVSEKSITEIARNKRKGQ